MFGRRKPSEPGGDATGARAAGIMARLGAALGRTRGRLVEGLARLLGGGAKVDEALLEELEDLLLAADVGVSVSSRVVEDLRTRARQAEGDAGEAVFDSLRESMLGVLRPVAVPLELSANDARPFVILVVGVNGTGKTTSIGKLAHRVKADGLSVMLAAGDTFRAAAIEQLQRWGERNDVPVVAQQIGADSASVIYDALSAAKARGVDVLIADTAGRLHTQADLMEELKKVRRVVTKLEPDAPHEVLLVLDAGTGQNALSQAVQFHQSLGVSGLCITKLDGTAKGGVVFAIADRLKIPIRFIGVGEGIDDLRSFDAEAFVDALLSH